MVRHSNQLVRLRCCLSQELYRRAIEAADSCLQPEPQPEALGLEVGVLLVSLSSLSTLLDYAVDGTGEKKEVGVGCDPEFRALFGGLFIVAFRGWTTC